MVQQVAPITEVSKALQLALWRVRNRIEYLQTHGQFSLDEPEWKTHLVPTFPGFNRWFPQTAKGGKEEERRGLRLNLIMALTGQIISSQYDLCVGYQRVLWEVLRADSTYLTPGLALELTEAVSGAYRSAPWEIPVSGLGS